LLIASLLGCATAGEEHQRTIEPPGGKVSAVAAPGNDEGVVLSREGGAAVVTADTKRPHIGGKWWPLRADFLKLSEGGAKDRDTVISESRAPADFWDKQTAVETHLGPSLQRVPWRPATLEGRHEHATSAGGLGKRNWSIFRNRRDYAAVFAIVSLGGPARNDKRSPMPAWTGKLAKEQMWALLYFLEYQSGGIEGRFPPSLYPRPLEEPR